MNRLPVVYLAEEKFLSIEGHHKLYRRSTEGLRTLPTYLREPTEIT